MTRLTFLDLKGAFETADRNILIYIIILRKRKKEKEQNCRRWELMTKRTNR